MLNTKKAPELAARGFNPCRCIQPVTVKMITMQRALIASATRTPTMATIFGEIVSLVGRVDTVAATNGAAGAAPSFTLNDTTGGVLCADARTYADAREYPHIYAIQEGDYVAVHGALVPGGGDRGAWTVRAFGIERITNMDRVTAHTLDIIAVALLHTRGPRG